MDRVKKCIHLLIIASLLAFTAIDMKAQSTARYVENQVIVKMKAGARMMDFDAVRSSLNARVAERFKLTGAELWDISGLSVEEAVKLYRDNPFIEYIEPNYFMHASETFPIDPIFSLQWSLHNIGQTGGAEDADIDAPEAWDYETGDSVIVAIIDCGVDYEHPDLAANIWINWDEYFGQTGVDDDGNDLVDDIRGWDFANNPDDNDPMDTYGHGTHVAGIVAAAGNDSVGISGVCWSAKIMILKFAYGSSGLVSNAILSISYAIEKGAKIINYSWNMPDYSQALKDAIAEARDAGILYVNSAGNHLKNIDVEPVYPAAFDLDNIIAVAATDHRDYRWIGSGVGSNYGANSVDLGAPGAEILSTFIDPDYEYKSGTSMAAPHVAGVAALLLSAHPELSYTDLKDIIMYNVDELSSLQGKTVSGGRLNAFNALQPDNTPPSAVDDLATSNPTSNSLDLTWTATGDDYSTGKACYYDIRYALSPIDESNFDDATQVGNGDRPKEAGSAETITVDGLSCGTIYYFAVKTSDEWGNWSGVSNCASGTTLGAPVISVYPTSLTEDLHAGESSVQYFAVENTGEGNLDYDISIDVNWLAADPVSGRLWAGDNQNIEITFDATELNAGDYDGTITVASNDPVTPEEYVSAHLSVTGEPDITVSKDTLDYGAVIVGLTESQLLTICNDGTDTLKVTEITIDNADFTTDTEPFALWANQSRHLTVRFTPSGIGIIEGTLTIQSNDPDESTVTVSLQGEGLDVPVISVSPASVDEIMFPDGELMRTLTISNEGGSDLTWSLRFAASSSITAMHVDLNGVKILYDRSHDQVSSSGWSTIKADLTARGATVSENSSTITPALLNNYDVFWSVDCSKFSWQAAEMDAIANWVKGGGGLLLEGDDLESLSPFNGILSRAGAGIHYDSDDGTSGTTTNIYPHETTVDVTSIYISDPEARLSSVAAPGAGLVKDNAGVWNTAYSMARIGRAVATAEELFSNGLINHADNRDFANQAFDWLAADWYSADQISGTLSPGASVDVAVTLDAAKLLTGDYNVVILVESNDPVNSDVSVPVHVEVMEAPECTVSAKIIRNGVPYQVNETFLFGCPAGDRGDVFEITCDFEDDFGIPINPEEITLDTENLPFSFCDPGYYGTPGTQENGYVVTLIRVHINGCSGCQGGGCDEGSVPPGDLPVIYKGSEIGVIEDLRVKSMDVTGDGVVDALELSGLGQTYNKPPEHPAFNSCYDYSGDGYVNLSDFAFLGDHYSHSCPTQPTPPQPADIPKSDVSVKLIAKQTDSPESREKLHVTIYIENAKSLSSVVMGMNNEISFIEYSKWLPNPDFPGVSAVMPIVKGDKNQLFIAAFGMGSINAAMCELGTLEYVIARDDKSIPSPTGLSAIDETDFVFALGNVIDLEGNVKQISGVDYEEQVPVYRNYLANNYPNPFNPTTTIEYSVKERAHVSLKIYNVAGQLVKTLVDEVQNRTSQSYVVQWDGHNDAGEPASSGIYFYRLVTKNFTQAKKMVLLK